MIPDPVEVVDLAHPRETAPCVEPRRPPRALQARGLDAQRTRPPPRQVQLEVRQQLPAEALTRRSGTTAIQYRSNVASVMGVAPKQA